MVKVIIERSYYARTRPGQEPIRFHARQPGGIGKPVHLEIKEDPVLRRHKDLQRALEAHEVHEARYWGEGKSNAHSLAKKHEPEMSKRIGGVSGFWKEVKRREKHD